MNITDNRWRREVTATFLQRSVCKRVWEASLKFSSVKKPPWCEVGFKSRPSGVKSRRCCCNKSDYLLAERRRPASPTLPSLYFVQSSQQILHAQGDLSSYVTTQEVTGTM
jgi:hypothetical protein